jgi:hypothetical protein
VFGRAAAACAARFACLCFWLIHVDPRHCSHAADAWGTRNAGQLIPVLGPSPNSVPETRGKQHF